MRRNRIEKTATRKLADLEDHLFLLNQHLSNLNNDLAYIKAVAAELRVLICKASGTEGLLWRLVDEYGVSDAVRLHVVGNLNPDHPMAQGINFSMIRISRPNPALEAMLPSRLCIFRMIIKECEAVYSLGESYTYERIIRAIAEQMGSAHEDNGIEPPVAEIEKILINGLRPYVSILRLIGEITAEIGERVIAAAETKGVYVRKRRR